MQDKFLDMGDLSTLRVTLSQWLSANEGNLNSEKVKTLLGKIETEENWQNWRGSVHTCTNSPVGEF